MACAAPGTDSAPAFPYAPLPAAGLPTQPLTPDSAFQAGKNFAADTREVAGAMINNRSAEYALPGYDQTPALAGTFDPFQLPKAQGTARQQACAKADLSKLPETDRRECEAINYLTKRVNTAKFTLDRQTDPLFKTYHEAETISASLGNMDCQLPGQPSMQSSFEERTCRESLVKSHQTCRDKLSVSAQEQDRDFDYSFTLNTDLRKWRAFCNDNESGRFSAYNFPLHKIVQSNGKTYRYIGLDASHQWGYEASCLMEEMNCERTSCDRSGNCYCINPSPSGVIVPRNEFLHVMTWWGEEDDADIWVTVDLEQKTAEINDAQLLDNGGIIMSWSADPLQMQGKTEMSVLDAPRDFQCAHVKPSNIRIFANASGGACENGRGCTVGAASVAEVDYQHCRVKLLFGKSGGDFHYLHNGWGARWTNKLTLRMFGTTVEMVDNWNSQCPDLPEATP
jgi:hypothetical protein